MGIRNYFKGDAEFYIFCLTELSGIKRMELLNITEQCYSNKTIAKKWRNTIAKTIHPDICDIETSKEALSQLNKIYENMIAK